MKLDLNCDLGEGEPRARTQSLMRWITSANVACGGHAGDPASMEMCVVLARRHGVRLGAHPGPWNRSDFGRQAVTLTPEELELLLLQQVGALERIARARGARLHHVKLHGALYHASEEHAALARRYLRTLRRWWPQCVVYARSGGRVARLAPDLGVKVWEEAFADRAYHDDGSLVSRQEPGAVLGNEPEVLARVRQLREQGGMTTASGRFLSLSARTICVHSDTPEAVRLVRSVAGLLG